MTKPVFTQDQQMLIAEIIDNWYYAHKDHLFEADPKPKTHWLGKYK